MKIVLFIMRKLQKAFYNNLKILGNVFLRKI